MKTLLKILSVTILLLSTLLFLSQCKSAPKENKSETKTTEITSAEIKEDLNTDSANESINESTNIPTKILTKDTIKVKAKQIPLTISITNLASATAPVIIGLYGTKNDFPNPEDQLKEYHFSTKGHELIAQITDLKFGTYAIALYQDENSSGAMDKNFLGIPLERYGFSNNVTPKTKAPTFDQCKFEYNLKSNKLNVTMVNY